MTMLNIRTVVMIAVVMGVAGIAHAAITIPGADGSDGEFTPTANIEVDLSQAATAQWDAPSPNSGKGVYDPDKWAVVFKYTEVDIPENVVVSFKNNASRAPVVWLVSGNISIRGTLSLNGSDGLYKPTGLSEPGPGGFRGGSPSTSGHGPGGANKVSQGGISGQAGIYAGGVRDIFRDDPVIYGNSQIVPLLGGSGGSGSLDISGGSGGGAILIACANTLSVQGTIRAIGGKCWHGGGSESQHGVGSGGAIRLICNEFSSTASASISTEGGWHYYAWNNDIGSSGRIRVECNLNRYSGSLRGSALVSVPSTPPLLWPLDTAPSLRITQIGGSSVTNYPTGSFDTPIDCIMDSTSPVKVKIEAKNVPTDWIVHVRMVPKSGVASKANAVFLSGNELSSIWEAQITIPREFSALQARAYRP